VIGPNGAGKSTLLNALMGVLPSKGVIEFDGQPISALSLEERVMLGIALVPEKRELFGTMPVEDNLVLGGFRHGCAFATSSGATASTRSTRCSRA
jgi:branched-chain amino acid transport system ATP-binding protein